MSKYLLPIALIMAAVVSGCGAKREQPLPSSIRPTALDFRKNEEAMKAHQLRCQPPHDAAYGAASRVNIKGYYLGMEECEVKEDIGSPSDSFTIAGIRVGEPMMTFVDHKLSEFYIGFPSSRFDAVHSAMMAKYPDIHCDKSEVGNAMGAKFNQLSCSLIYTEGTLLLYRYASEITRSGLLLISHEATEKKAKANLIKEKDL